MKDIFLEKMFLDTWRWQEAIEKADLKGIEKRMLQKLTSPSVRASLYIKIRDGNYEIAPPHIALIPKDNGEFREVMVCEPMDRVLLSIINDMFFEMFPEYIHHSCYSYRKGIGTWKVVRDASGYISQLKINVIGKKYDLRKYFDSVAIKYINDLFDKMESKVGKSVIIDIVRRFYNNNWLFDKDKNLVKVFKSIKQGTATSSFLADALLCHIDEELSQVQGIRYWRYSDDCLIIGNNWQKGDKILKQRLSEIGLSVNEKKEELLYKDKFFKFLGFSLRGSEISLSKNRIKTFQKEIERRTKGKSLVKAVNAVNSWLYKGDGTHSWATGVLSVVNVNEDIQTLNTFVMDSLRATVTGKRKIGGLGYEVVKKCGVITRGRGRNVTSNLRKTEHIDGYKSLMCMKKALLTSKSAYDTIVRGL